MRSLILFALSISPAFGAWTTCKKVTIGASVVVGGPHSNFKLHIKGTYTWAASTGNGGLITDAQGDDIRVYSTSDCTTTALDYEKVEWFDNGTIHFVVRVASLDNGSTVYIGAGDAAVTTDGSNKTAVYAEELMVYHFKDGTTLAVTDSSVGARDLTNNGAVAIAGKLGGAVDFDTATDNLTRASSLSATTLTSFCGWVYPETLDTTARRIFDNGVTALIDQLINWTTDGLRYNYRWSTSTDTVGAWYVTALPTGAWAHVCVTYDKSLTSNNPLIYVNGASQSVTEINAPSGTASASVGDTYYLGNRSTGDRPLDGRLDEFVRDDVIFSANLIATMYANQNAPDTFYAITDQTSRRRVIDVK